MKTHSRSACATLRAVAISAALFTIALLTTPITAADLPEALTALEKERVPGGLALMIGPTDLEAARTLAGSGRFLVHLLVPAERVEALRREALEAGIHGTVCIGARPTDGRLRHPSRFVDLVVADPAAPGCPPMAELLRVASVQARMLIAERGDWKAGIRPPEAGIAEWSHKWRDATGHQLSPDTKAGPPITVQWQAGPALADGAGGGKTPVIAEGFFACVDDADGEKRSGKGIAVRSAGNGLSRLRTPRISNPDAELIIADGKLIVDARPLHVIDLRTGADAVLAESARKGASVIGKESGPTLTSTVVAEKILLTCEENELVAVDLPAGGRRWSNRLDDAVWFSPRITGGLAIAVECPWPAARSSRTRQSA